MKPSLNAIFRFIAIPAMRSMLLFVALVATDLQAVVWDSLDEFGGIAHWDDLSVIVQIDRPQKGEATVCFSDIECVYPNGHMWIPTVPSVLPIPSECNGVPVTTISRRALSPLWVAEGTDITGSPPYLWERGVSSIVIPESVVTIEDEAFCGNPVLRTVSLPSGLQSLGEYVFSGCTALASASIPSHIADLPTGLFARCSGLQTVLLPRGLKNIGVYSFRNCSALSSLSIPDSVEAIGGYAFENCSALTSVSIPASVKEIGEGAFRGCSSLQTIHFPTNFYGKTDTLGIPPGCTIVFGEPLALVVSSNIDRTVPNPGVISLFRGASVTCRAETFEDDDRPGFQYECLGWAGSGSVPAFGSGTEVSFVLESESSITWNWGTNVWLDCVLSGEVSPVAVAQWQSFGEPLVVPFEIGTTNASVVFSGDADGVVFDPVAKTVSIPADRPRALFVQIGYGTRIFTHMVLSPQSGGDAEWRMEANSEAVDGYCFRSGEIEQGETSTVEMHVEGAGILTFDWKISANRSDWAYFYVDGDLAASITRSTDWANVSTNLADGTHVLRWVFDRHASAAANAEAAFLDNISWRPWLTLTVSSTFGTPSPAVGTTRVSYGDLVSASVVAPAAANGTRLVCTGWTGSGSVPTEGASSSVQFVMTKSTTLVWRWRTDHWIDASVDSGGSTSFQPQWAEHGSTVVIPLVSATHLFDVSLSGDTDGVTVSGASVQIPADKTRTVHIAMSEIKLPLVVANEHGDSLPEAGAHSLSWGTFVMASASDPDPASGFSYHCTGWRGTGSVPSEGVGSVARFTMEEPSTLSWLWQTNFWVELSVQGAIAVDVSGSWVSSGESLVVPYAPLSDYATIVASGDADGVVINATAQTITIPADRPRSVIINASAMSLASALDATGLVWTTSGSDVWIPQREVSSDGVDAAESGDATGGDSILETAVLGAGTLSWFWKMNASGWAGVDASVDGRDVAYLETSGDWTSASTQISGEGSHTVQFAFWTEEGGTSSDRAYLDRVSWTGATIPRTTQTTPEAVPYAWLDRWPGLLADNGGDYERAAAAIAANGINTVWECYVAGLDPTVPSAAFRVNISMDGDEPRIDWTPDLGAARDYRLEGRTEFGDIDGWESPVTDDHRFFRARVSLPDASGSVEEDDAFPGFVTVTFDANGGMVETQSKDYTATGTLGTLPVPVRDGFPFLGWYTQPTRGIRVSQHTPIPYRDIRLFARWNYCNVRFDGNGGTGTMEGIRYSFGLDSGLPINKFIRHGYEFAGWTLTPTGTVLCKDGDAFPSGVVEAESEVVLYAKWTPNRCTFVFNSNGGTGSMPTIRLKTGDSLPRNAFGCVGRYFAGWATNQLGGVTFEDCENLINDCPEKTITLYAVWSEYFLGLSVRYYDISSSGYSTWIESEAAMKSYFDEKTSTIATNTLDWSAGLDAGFSNPTGSDGNNWVSSGMTRPNVTCLFHGEYASSSKDRFAVLLDGYLFVTDSGAYQFAAVADDAVILYVDGSNVLANGENWGNMATGEIALSAGLHSVSIGFYEYTGGQGLSVQWKKPGDSSYVPIPQAALRHKHVQLAFDANGGEGNMVACYLDCAFRIERIPSCEFVRPGWTFVGWARTNDGPVEWIDGEMHPGNLPIIDETATLFARWSQNICTIHFDANGGRGVMEDFIFGKDIPSQHLPPNSFENNGCTFSGWALNQTSAAYYEDGDSISVVSLPFVDSEGTLYAVWRNEAWSWQTIGDAVEITGCSLNGNLIIPKTIDCKLVIGVADSAFYRRTDLLSVTIPDSVTSIGESAFEGCGNLTNVSLTNGMKHIGFRSFFNCRQLTSITIPDSVISIGNGAFCDCTGLTSITIPASVTSIERGAFCRCSGLTSITILGNLTSLREALFDGCSSLKSFVIPNSVTQIEDYVFRNCSELESIVIPNTVTYIGRNSFSNCSKLTSIVIPSSVRSWGLWAFSGSGLENVTISEGVTCIGERAFWACFKLSEIAIPDSVTSIGSYAFKDCSGISSITIPDGVISIGEGAFEGCSGLTSLSLPSCFKGKTSNMGIPSGCTVAFRE